MTVATDTRVLNTQAMGRLAPVGDLLDSYEFEPECDGAWDECVFYEPVAWIRKDPCCNRVRLFCNPCRARTYDWMWMKKAAMKHGPVVVFCRFCRTNLCTQDPVELDNFHRWYPYVKETS